MQDHKSHKFVFSLFSSSVVIFVKFWDFTLNLVVLYLKNNPFFSAHLDTPDHAVCCFLLIFSLPILLKCIAEIFLVVIANYLCGFLGIAVCLSFLFLQVQLTRSAPV